jgi:Rha family phage regulatory protein
MNNPKLTVVNGHAVTNSLDVAKFFERRHDNVIKAIREVLPYVSEGFSLLNFEERTYQDERGKTYPCYVLTRSGFAMIALGFTGEKATRFREAYITRFDEMEAHLKAKELASIERRYVEEKYLPFDTPVIRASVPISDALKHLHILGLYLDWTSARLKSRVKRGELEGVQDSRGRWRIYTDEVTKLATARQM